MGDFQQALVTHSLNIVIKTVSTSFLFVFGFILRFWNLKSPTKKVNINQLVFVFCCCCFFCIFFYGSIWKSFTFLRVTTKTACMWFRDKLIEKKHPRKIEKSIGILLIFFSRSTTTTTRQSEKSRKTRLTVKSVKHSN